MSTTPILKTEKHIVTDSQLPPIAELAFQTNVTPINLTDELHSLVDLTVTDELRSVVDLTGITERVAEEDDNTITELDQAAETLAQISTLLKDHCQRGAKVAIKKGKRKRQTELRGHLDRGESMTRPRRFVARNNELLTN